MKIRELRELGSGLDKLVQRIPFVRELRASDPEQFQLLMTYCCLVDLAPGEVIMRRGEQGSWLYFLIRGRLNVYADQPLPSAVINHITPGELFGDLALISEQQRKATVAADSDERGAQLFACDFKPFGALMDFHSLRLSTKLQFYRTMVHSIRWRLEVNRMASPGHPLVADLRRVPVFSGARGGIAELQALHQQASVLAALLEHWNSARSSADGLLIAGADTG
ncbi:MAG: cyclic nucleotide-binding domain-containing protein [Spongiibacteraceae bacterium]|jgi:hypothetical protein|nr:cyclic nucleotide-binding domain-containing protein [Spongiibacteraceae bacterium]